MTTASSPQKSRDRFWMDLVGGVFLAAFGVYGLITHSGASPRYALALVAFGLAGVARAMASSYDDRTIAQAPHFLMGGGIGLIIAGFIG